MLTFLKKKENIFHTTRSMVGRETWCRKNNRSLKMAINNFALLSFFDNFVSSIETYPDGTER
jgi:hypothetical protein